MWNNWFLPQKTFVSSWILCQGGKRKGDVEGLFIVFIIHRKTTNHNGKDTVQQWQNYDFRSNIGAFWGIFPKTALTSCQEKRTLMYQ